MKRIDEIIEKPAKIRKRNIVAATITLLFILSLVATISGFKASIGEKKAKREAETARQVSDFLINLFEVSDPNEARGSKQIDDNNWNSLYQSRFLQRCQASIKKIFGFKRRDLWQAKF